MSSVLKERNEFAEKDGSFEHTTLSKNGIFGKTARYDRDFLVSTENKKYKVTHINDLCYNPANLKFGVICLNKYGDAIFSPIYVTFEIQSDYDADFVGENLSRWDFINKALRYQQGTVYERMAVSPEDFLSIKCYMPSKREQEKLSRFIGLLDEKIVSQQKYIDNLKKYKRGAIRQILLPKSCPLKNAKWTTTRMSELGSFVKGASLSKADISEEGTPFILYGELYTTYNEVITNIKRHTQAKVDELYLSCVGDVVIPTSGETPEEISTASCVMLPGVILAGDLNIFRSSKVDGRIISYLLNHVVNAKIARIAQGKSVVHIQASELGKLTLSYPDENTQRTIIDFLSKLDEKIISEENALTFLTDLKEGLMQQLFI